MVGYFSVIGYSRVDSNGSPEPTSQRSPLTFELAASPKSFVEKVLSLPRTSSAVAAVSSFILLPGMSDIED